jgi:hypothetical protein
MMSPSLHSGAQLLYAPHPYVVLNENGFGHM